MGEADLPARSALARLQQFTTLMLAASAIGWLAWHWRQSPWLALAGLGLVVFGYSGFLAVEFIALHVVSRHDPAPRPTWADLARAWLGETLVAPKVFYWRQPFQSNEAPDHLGPAAEVHGRRGAVFIHGFVCNRGFWTPWLSQLKGKGHAFVAVNLEPVFGSIDDYIPIIERAVTQVNAATGLPPVLICHSMGGLAARCWLDALQAHERVHGVVTIGTPHGGTWLGRFSRTRNGRQMHIGSDWLRQLGPHAGKEGRAAFTCWYSNCDNVVFPASCATLPGADNRLVEGVAHVELAFERQVMAATLAMVTAPACADRGPAADWSQEHRPYPLP